jgi:hypothetical protein
VDRRADANRFYAGINTAIFGAAGFLLYGNESKADLNKDALLLGFPLAGLFLSFVWGNVVHSQRKILGQKFRVIHKLEEQLPVQPYKLELERENGPQPKEETQKEKKPDRIRLGSFEQWLPRLFVGFHALFLGYLIWKCPVVTDWIRTLPWIPGRS